MAAANTVDESALDRDIDTIELNRDLKPAACAGIWLVNAVDGGGAKKIDDLSGNTLILGSADGDNIRGKKGDGDDCIVGGGGNDHINGGPGNDVLIGGPGHDNCDGGGGTDIYIDCEVIH